MTLPNGKAAAILSRKCLIVKLLAELHKEALSLDGCKLFDPAGGRPIKEWVQVPLIDVKSHNRFNPSNPGVQSIKYRSINHGHRTGARKLFPVNPCCFQFIYIHIGRNIFALIFTVPSEVNVIAFIKENSPLYHRTRIGKCILWR